MALFGAKKKNETKSDSGKESVSLALPDSKAGSSNILKNMRITEKVSMLAERNNVYTFNVTVEANKKTIADSITRLYKIRPLKVRIVRVPSKRVVVRGKRGVKSGGRKAYVYLKKGEKIEIA